MRLATRIACGVACVFLLQDVALGREWRRGTRNGYFPFTPVHTQSGWDLRQAEIKQRILVSAGLWPMPERTRLNAVRHGRIDRGEYTIERVFFESLPGHYVTGSLYLPKVRSGRIPAILSPYGHWAKGRFMDRGIGTADTLKELESGAERHESAARSPLQARCVQLVRMGCAVFIYDMLGYADSIQFPAHRHGITTDGFLSVPAELRLQTLFGLQTWNSLRALDFMLSVEGIDPGRIGCTGASGGGTQTMILSAIDERIAAAFPCVMVSTDMQGGCPCENSHYLRINQGNIDIAAATAPRPLGLTAADDWTKELGVKGLPDLRRLYTMLGVPENLTAHLAIEFPHNYNLHSRLAMYRFYNEHFDLGAKGPVAERDFVVETKERLTVWTADYPPPHGDGAGREHEKAVRDWMTAQDRKNIDPLVESADTSKLREVAGTAWKIIIGRSPPAAGEAVFVSEPTVQRSGFSEVRGVARNIPAKEELECTLLLPDNWKGSLALWLRSAGPASILADGQPPAAVDKLLRAGVAVACPTLYMHGAAQTPEVGESSDPAEFRSFSGYTYGYNPTLLARRTHDAMTTAAAVRKHLNVPVHEKIAIIGVEGAAPVAAAAGMMLHGEISRIGVDTDGFDFDKVASHRDVNFVPGAVKYGGMPVLLKLCAPAHVAQAETVETLVAHILEPVKDAQ